MSQFKFQIGSGPFVRISLPSKAPGDCDMFRGKAVIVCNSLQCSAEVEFTRSVLERFAADLQRIDDTLKGSFHLVSSDTRFKMAVVGDNKGRIRLDIVVSGFQFSQPENSEWSASATFTCFPHEIENAIQQMEEANKSSLLTGHQPNLLTPSSIQSRP
jgi:hypothetical protein